MFRTEKGYIGLASALAESGDRIGVVTGGKLPLILRSVEDKWQFRGDCYVHGIMYGQAYDACSTETVVVV